MKILFASSSSGSKGGGELFLVYLGRALARRGHEVALWCSAHPDLDALSSQFEGFGTVLRGDYTNTYHRRLRSFRSFLPHPEAVTFARQWKDFAPDVLHLNKQCLEDGLDLLVAANKSGLPSCCTIHITQSAAELKAAWAAPRDWISRWHLRRYRGQLLAISAKRGRELEAFVGNARRIPSIDNGVEVPDSGKLRSLRETTRADLPGSPADNDPVVVTVGRLEAQKQPLRFLEMALAFRQREPHAQFYWVGDGRLRPEWDAWLDAHDAGSFIHNLGWQTEPQRFLAAADFYFHPALFEGLPFALLEAMACGLPSVISPELAAELDFLTEKEIVITGSDNGWIERLRDSESAQALGAAARRLVQDRFSVDAMAAGYETVYGSLEVRT